MAYKPDQTKKRLEILKEQIDQFFSFEELTTICLDEILIMDAPNAVRSFLNKNPKLLFSLHNLYGEIKFSLIQKLISAKLEFWPKCSCGADVLIDKQIHDRCKDCIKKENYSNIPTNRRNKLHNISDFYKIDEVKEKIKIVETISDRNFYESLFKIDPVLVASIEHHTNYLSENCKFSERVFHLVNGFSETVKCAYCEKNSVKFLSYNTGYSTTCSYKCSKFILKKMSEEINKKISITRRTNFVDILFEEFTQKMITVLSSKEDFIYDGIVNLKCDKCGDAFQREMPDVSFRTGCPRCCASGKSFPEMEIKNFLEQYVEVQQSNRTLIKPYEVDLFVKSHNLAIEYNGLYWHSANSVETDEQEKHLKKTNWCEDKGIKLIHIFEDEWLDETRQIIWKSMLMNAIGKSSTVFARKCQIRDVPATIANEFQDKNHLAGSARASIRLGLFYENELVCLATLGKPRFDKAHDLELIRFCTKTGHSVIGGFSKILAELSKRYPAKNLISYADKRFSIGEVYFRNGFEYLRETKPNYFYFKNNSLNREPREKYQKHKLPALLENFDQSKTESENMFNHNYRKIYDCGSLVFSKQL